MFVSMAKADHMAKPRVSMGGDRACENFGYVTATIYHLSFAKPGAVQYWLGRIQKRASSVEWHCVSSLLGSS